jgi:catechol 2,3-dioxygenase-like lactoylglutathione lyase family enzyme
MTRQVPKTSCCQQVPSFRNDLCIERTSEGDDMRVFLSWSGPESFAVAQALHAWLRGVLHTVDPWMSPDTDKGTRWSEEIIKQLEATPFGIVCLTRDNVRAPWLLFETGALAKAPNAKVCMFLLDLSPSEVELPFAIFQATTISRADILRLLETLHVEAVRSGEHQLSELRLRESFDLHWPTLESRLMTILAGRLDRSWYVRQLHHTSLPVTDLAVSCRFYSEILGLRQVERPKYVPFTGAWFLLPSGQHLHLLQNDDGTYREGFGKDESGKFRRDVSRDVTINEIRDCHFALRVTNIIEARDYLRSKGCIVKGADEDQLLPRYPAYYVLDPDGHVIELNERRPGEVDPPYIAPDSACTA